MKSFSRPRPIQPQLLLALIALAILYPSAPTAAQEEAKELDETTISELAKTAVERAAKDVEQHGWHFVGVSGDESENGFLFTVGLWRTYKHPEIILFAPSQDPQGMAGRLVAVAERVVAGQTFEVDHGYEGLFGRFSGAFRRVDVGWYEHYLGTAAAYYESFDFPAIQLFWPDGEDRFPWNKGFTKSLREFQPALYEAGESDAE